MNRHTIGRTFGAIGAIGFLVAALTDSVPYELTGLIYIVVGFLLDCYPFRKPDR